MARYMRRPEALETEWYCCEASVRLVSVRSQSKCDLSLHGPGCLDERSPNAQIGSWPMDLRGPVVARSILFVIGLPLLRHHGWSACRSTPTWRATSFWSSLSHRGI
jgi:hypothetical protein